MGTCNYVQADLDVIIPRLIAVCKQGSDASHPYGASSVSPSSTYPYHSFEDVIRDYNSSHGKPYNAACNAYLIDYPKPYNQPAVLINRPVMSKPDSCSCTRISSLNAQYLAKPAGAANLSQWLQTNYQTTITQGALDTLLGLCANTITCKFITQVIQIPPALQCGAVSPCVNCDQFRAVYDSFLVAFPGNVPTLLEPTDSQLVINQLFQSYMNTRLGFNKTIIEYLGFRDTCLGGKGGACDAMAKIVEGYRAIRKEIVDGKVASGFRMTPVVDEIKEGMNGLLEWKRRASTGRYLSPRFKYLPVNYSPVNKIYGISYTNQSGTDSIFNMVLGVNLKYVANPSGIYNTMLATQVVRDTDYVGSSSSADYAKQFYGFSLMEEWGRWRFMYAPRKAWQGGEGACVATNLAAYYGLNAPHRKFLNDSLCTEYSNGYLEAAFYPLPPGTTTIAQYRATISMVTDKINRLPGSSIYEDDRLPDGGLRDTLKTSTKIFQNVNIKRIVDFSLDTAFLRLYSQSGDLYYHLNRAEYIKASLEMMDGSFKTAYYLGGDFIYKELVDTNIYNQDCQKGFAAYYNFKRGTNLTYAQIAARYLDSCGIVLNVCNIPGPLLCGQTNPTAPPVVIVQPDACSDSLFLITLTATELYRSYRDSLRGAFEEAYTQKCLGAVALESLTLKQDISEYHYTLYYYDQAGNLVKTVAPAGVNPDRRPDSLASVASKRALGQFQVPAHTFKTNYRYNSLNQVTAQNSPDAGTGRFWYDRIGRLAISQNARQILSSKYSFTQYDYLGRIWQVGEKVQPLVLPITTLRSATALRKWIEFRNDLATYQPIDVVQTTYDVTSDLVGVYSSLTPFRQSGYTLRNRVSYGRYFSLLPSSLVVNAGDSSYVPNNGYYESGIDYSYDIHGNVDSLLNIFGRGMAMLFHEGNRFKYIAYNFDLISGKVNSVHYNPDNNDEFYHRYSYDAENRITDVYTTDTRPFINQIGLEEHEAHYSYYKHGPLMREVIGQQQVQGMDFTYTLQGWIKGVNNTTLLGSGDIGNDSVITARDAYSYNLNYFNGDYTAINGLQPFADHQAKLGTACKELYNGNINSMALNLRQFSQPQLYNYRYDQLNRITAMDVYRSDMNGIKANSWTSSAFTTDYLERVSYDPNGNILNYLRNGSGPTNIMDSLKYRYMVGTDRLNYIRDSFNMTNIDANFADDLDNQKPNNYQYDPIGNLIRDSTNRINNIIWNVYGKILTVSKTYPPSPTGSLRYVDYTYDAAGNRIAKTIYRGSGDPEWTSYVLDAQGNIMAEYEKKKPIAEDTMYLTRHYIYGAKRLGIISRSLNISSSRFYETTVSLIGKVYRSAFQRGKVYYEMTNHLSNIVLTTSDKKSGPVNPSIIGDVLYSDPEVLTAKDYHPFGMGMSNRDYKKLNLRDYHFGFNGQKKTVELSDNHYEAKFWEYDSRVGRRWNLDPIPKYWESGYATFSNSPIFRSDPNGDIDSVPNKSTVVSVSMGTTFGPGRRDHNTSIYPLYGGRTYYTSSVNGTDDNGNRTFQIDEPNSFVQVQVQIPDKRYSFGVNYFKQKYRDDPETGFGIEAPTAFQAAVGVERNLASLSKKLEINGNVSLGVGPELGVPRNRQYPDITFKSKGLIGDYRIIGVGAAIIYRVDVTYVQRINVFVSGTVHHMQTFNQHPSSGSFPGATIGSVGFAAGIGFDFGGK